MKNHRPEFTDRQLRLIEDAISELRGDDIFDKGYTPYELNELFWKCKFYRIGFRKCKECGKHIECKELNEQYLCKECQPLVQEKCYHGSYHQEGNNWHCSTCGKIDNDLGGYY